MNIFETYSFFAAMYWPKLYT